LITAFVVVASLYAFTTPASSEEVQRMYLGVAKCKTCHKTAAQGEQFPKWEKGPHAGAYATLASEESKKIAAEKGIEDPQKSDECLSCHVTGHGVDAKFFGEKFDMTMGVQCESCHGAGGDYYKMATMKGITSGEIDGATVGLVEPNAELCTGCHNEKSPTYKGFEYDKAAAAIAHNLPEERKAKYAK
jgi:hypothetical protein